MKILAVSAAVLLASPAYGNEQTYLSVCDKVISGRLPQPKTYRRLSSDMKTEIHDRGYVLENFVPKDKPERIEKFDAGEWSPRSITLVIDYEAANSDRDLVHKRSVCEFTLSGPEVEPSADFVIVDGEMEGLR